MKNVQVLQEIGRGAFATVYKVINNKYLQAMKSIDLEQSENVITQELSILQSLNHPNIVRFYYAYLNNTSLNIFMEYCGCSLSDIIKYTKLSDEQAFFLLNYLIESLKYLHSHSIVHDDVKPQNILMQNATCKLTDFGISHQSLSLYNYQGTPSYSAPEAYHGKTTFASDYYALGIIYCEMVSQELLLHEFYTLEEIFKQKENIMDHVKKLNLSRKGLEFCEHCLVRRESADALLKCKGFKNIDTVAVQNELTTIYKKVTRQKEFYCPGVTNLNFQEQLANYISEWSFSQDVDQQPTKGFYIRTIEDAFKMENVSLGRMSEAQAKSIYQRLNGMTCFVSAANDITEEQKMVLNMLD